MAASLEITRQRHHPWRKQASFANISRKLRFDDLAVLINIQLHAMLNNVKELLRQVDLQQSRLCLVECSQTASSNFFCREFVDYSSIDFIRLERLAGMLLVSPLAADSAFDLFLPTNLWTLQIALKLALLDQEPVLFLNRH